ncbi:MAG: hypothetical protein QOH06_2536 [Acidobacteriota bacterium]|jgi:hypothetical protein|nr:hypothetical protein [Acidobacteriota bacterium]
MTRMSWAGRLVRNVLLWTIPAWAAWALLTPVYNRFLVVAAENLLQISESPNVTDLHLRGRHDAYVQRRDFPHAKSLVHAFRMTDLHFHLVLLGALFLGVPDVSWKKKLENLGWAVLVTVFFDLFLCFFVVKAAYATKLGAWSLTHYGPFARNTYGLVRHLLDLPFKLGLPLLLWSGFYLGRMMEEIRPARTP